MKFKIASVVELAVPISILVVISLSACGGGSGAYGGPNAYDGRWTVVDTGYTQPTFTAVAPDTAVSCREDNTFITITHGYGSGTQIMHCVGNITGVQYGSDFYMNLGVTVTPNPAASGVTGTLMLVTTGGGGSYGSAGANTTGACPSRDFCGVPDPVKFDMWRCGTPAAAQRGC